MEQTQNTFTSGLQMDTHPMQQGQDTLTDALNATFVTMNGNEIVLQNDMGNAKVQNAYLPKGYVPVGMKEYGGVIYVASYNPLTDRSQIGSFPSPQRRFFEKSEGGGACFNPGESFLNETELKTRSVLIPIKGDKVLRAGDKFILYFDGSGCDFKNYISNWENIDIVKDKVKSPKNNYFTLSVGILNSRNEFVDITKSLMRFDEKGKPISFKDSDSELYKFNKGYFIASTIDINNLPKDDAALAKLKNLDEFPLNTYSYKLVGPLYLKAEVNAPLDFDYSISGYPINNGTLLNYNDIEYVFMEQMFRYNDNIYYVWRNNNKEYCYTLTSDPGQNIDVYFKNDLNEIIQDGTGEIKTEQLSGYEMKISAKLTYNCPDGIDESANLGDSQYSSYYTGSIESDKLYFNINFKDINNQEQEIPQLDDKNQYTVSYDGENYNVTISKTYILPRDNSTNSILEYSVVPTFKFPTDCDGNYSYVEVSDLKRVGSIDLSKLASGKMEMTAWRFYNDLQNEKTAITFGFEAYPREGQEFKDLTFNFYRVLGTSDVVISSDTISGVEAVGSYKVDSEIGYNGLQDVVIDWNNLEELSGVKNSIEKQNLYQVIISWNSYYDGQITREYDYRWLLTTELFNNSYSQNSESFITDFCNPEKGTEESIYENLTTISPHLISSTPNIKETEKKEPLELGSLVVNSENLKQNDGKKFIVWGNQTLFDTKINFNISLTWNKDNYPSYIKVINSPNIFCENIKYDYNNKYNPFNNNDWILINNNSDPSLIIFGNNNKESIENNFYKNTFTVNYHDQVNTRDWLIANPKTLNTNFLKGRFETFHDYIERNSNETSEFKPQVAINVVNRNKGKGDTYHKIYVSQNKYVAGDTHHGLFFGPNAIEKFIGDGYCVGATYATNQSKAIEHRSNGDYEHSFLYGDIINQINGAFNKTLNKTYPFVLQGVSVTVSNLPNHVGRNLIWVKTMINNELTWSLYNIKDLSDKHVFKYSNNMTGKNHTQYHDYSSDLDKIAEYFPKSNEYIACFDRNGVNIDNTNLFKAESISKANERYKSDIIRTFNFVYK